MMTKRSDYYSHHHYKMSLKYDFKKCCRGFLLSSKHVPTFSLGTIPCLLIGWERNTALPLAVTRALCVLIKTDQTRPSDNICLFYLITAFKTPIQRFPKWHFHSFLHVHHPPRGWPLRLTSTTMMLRIPTRQCCDKSIWVCIAPDCKCFIGGGDLFIFSLPFDAYNCSFLNIILV